MNIMVRVTSGAARAEIAKLRTELALMQRQTAAASGASSAMGATMAKSISPISKWGNQIQWAGRQLQYNFTLPLMLAGGAAMKFELDNEKAMTRVAKVYGDNTPVFNKLAEKEIPALGRAFEALSNKFGVAQSEVINIGADWAAAGASGLALAKAVDLTMKTIVLGELDAKTATQSLIAIQAQYGASTDQLTKIIETLNMVENQTGTSMAGLIEGMTRAAGVARTAGVDYLHLTAMIAALSPAAGGAAAAGTALKTIFSRLLKPTTDTVEVLGLMGINTKEAGWQSLNATQRLSKMAETMQGLSAAQKVVVDATIASNWQINKFDVLMKALVGTASYYTKAIQTAGDAHANFLQAQKELDLVLKSNPQRLKQIGAILQNSLADIIQPLIPALIMLATSIANAFRAFQNLNPVIQKFVLYGLLMLAVIGPIARYVGATVTLFKILGDVVLWVGPAFLAMGRSMITLVTGPFQLLMMGIGRLSALLTLFATATIRGIVVPALGMLGSVLAGSATGIVAVFGGVLKYGFLIAASGVWAVLTSIVAMMGAFIPALQGATITMVTSLAKVWQLFEAGMVVAWGAMHQAMITVSAVFGRIMPAIQYGIALSIVKVWFAVEKVITLIWATMFDLAAIRGLIIRFGTFLVSGVAGIGAALEAVMGLLLSPWALLAAAVIGVLYALRNRIKRAWDVIVNEAVTAFNGLPRGIYGAMKAVVDIIAAAARAVYKWFSYLNPFAHHSPSLVEVVTWGMAEIKKQYGSVGDVGSVFKKAASDLAAFKNAAAGLGQGKFDDTFKNLKDNLPQLIPLFKTLEGDWSNLNSLLDAQQSKVDAQQKVVDKWNVKLQAANATLDAQQATLDALQKKLTGLSDEYDKHQQAAQNFADAPIQGMKAMSDAMFTNQMAQKKLQLQILQWEQTHGSIDSITNSMAKLQGEIESMRGNMIDLQKSGAGSDITGPMQQQIDAMTASFQDMQNTVQNSPVADMQKQLEDLQKQGQILDLQNSINFDPLKKNIQDLINTENELPYDTIVAGIQREKAAMAALQPQIDAATKAVDAQTKAVGAAQAARDQISAIYDVESKKLQNLKDQYDQIQQAVRDVESAMNDMNSAASKAGQAKSGGPSTPSGQAFVDAAGGNFPDVGGAGGIGRAGGMGDQSKAIDDFAKKISEDAGKTFGKIDMFKPFKDMWNSAWAWIEKNIMPTVHKIGKIISDAGAAFGNPFENLKVPGGLSGALSKVGSVFTTVFNGISKVAKLFWPDIKRIWDIIFNAGKEAFQKLGPEIQKFVQLLGPLFNALKPIAEILGVALLFAIKLVAGVIVNVLGPVLNGIITILQGVIQFIRGFIQIITAIFTGDWAMLWDGVWNIVSGAWKMIVGLFSGVVGTIIGIVRGLIDGIIGFFQWLFDELVGHSIIPDMIKAIVGWFVRFPGMVMSAIIGLGQKLFDWAKAALGLAWSAFKSVWNSIVGWLGGIIGGFFRAIGDLGTAAWNWAVAAFRRILDGYKNIWNSITSWLGGIIKGVLNALGDLGTSLWNWGKAAFQRVLDGYKRIWEDIKKWLGGLGQLMLNAFGDVGSLFLNAGKHIVQMLADGISSVADLPGKALKGIVHGLSSLIPGSPVKEGPLMSLNNGHSGGMISKMLADGISGGQSDVVRAATAVAQAAHNALNDTGAMSGIDVQSRYAGYTGGVASAIASKLSIASGSSQQSVASNSGTTELHFHGDLSFPNIKTSGDAEEFINNLKTLAGK